MHGVDGCPGELGMQTQRGGGDFGCEYGQKVTTVTGVGRGES